MQHRCQICRSATLSPFIFVSILRIEHFPGKPHTVAKTPHSVRINADRRKKKEKRVILTKKRATPVVSYGWEYAKSIVKFFFCELTNRFDKVYS